MALVQSYIGDRLAQRGQMAAGVLPVYWGGSFLPSAPFLANALKLVPTQGLRYDGFKPALGTQFLLADGFDILAHAHRLGIENHEFCTRHLSVAVVFFQEFNG